MNSNKMIFRALYSTVFAIGLSAALQAQEAPIIKSISVQYVGAKSVSKQRILTRLSTKVGQRISEFRVNDDIKKLYVSGDVENAKMITKEAKGGVDLILIVECRPLHGGVKFSGNSVFSDHRLAKSVRLPLNKPIDESAIHSARRDIQTLYTKKGYPEARIKSKITAPNSRGNSLVVFTIEEGSQGFLRTVHFEKNKAFPDSRLKEVMEQKEKGIKSLIRGGGRTDPKSITEDAKAIEDLYRDHGYLDARVVKVAKIPVDAKYNDLVFTIQEGILYTISEIDISGVSALSKDKDLAPYLKTLVGKPFSASALREDMKMIGEQYGSRGFLDTKIVPRIEYANPE